MRRVKHTAFDIRRCWCPQCPTHIPVLTLVRISPCPPIVISRRPHSGRDQYASFPRRRQRGPHEGRKPFASVFLPLSIDYRQRRRRSPEYALSARRPLRHAGYDGKIPFGAGAMTAAFCPDARLPRVQFHRRADFG